MRRRTLWLVVMLTAAITLFCLSLIQVMQRDRAQEPATPERSMEEIPPESPPPATTAGQGRKVVSPEKGDGPPEPAGPVDFDARLEALVQTAVEVTERAERGDTENARAMDQEGRRDFHALRAAFPDADERALFVRTGLMVEDQTTRTLARRRLCVMLIEHGLEDRARQRSANGRSRRLEQLVSMLLAVLPQDDSLAEDFIPLLLRGECLAADHERAVMDFVAHAAGPGRTRLTGFAADLLLALWRSLERSGARVSAELDALALLFQDGGNPVERLAAVRRLLTTQEGRLREATLQAVTQRGDPELAQAIAVSATTSLPTREAFEILTRLQPILGHRSMPAVVQLGLRDPELLREAYELRLAQGTDAGLRAELVTGAAFGDPTKGLAVATLAFREDQDREVRARALLALTGRGSSLEGERALHAALDDAQLAAEPTWLGRCVLALENLARTADPNMIQAVARRLQANSKLSDGDRARLELLLTRTLPR